MVIPTIEVPGMGPVTGTMKVLTMEIGTGPTMGIGRAVHDKNLSQKSKLLVHEVERWFRFGWDRCLVV